MIRLISVRIELGGTTEIREHMSKRTRRTRQQRYRSLEPLESRQMLTVVSELVADIRDGQKGSEVGFELHEFNGEIYFSADNGQVGKELWKTDGTTAGTQLVKDIHVGNEDADSFPGWFTEYKGELYFTAVDASRGEELWKTDGTAAGTVLIKDINGGDDGSVPTELVIFKNEIYFAASDGSNNDELWKSDGTASGTKLVKDIRSQSSSSPGNASGLYEFNDFLYFNARDNANGVELWRSDGTEAGTTLVLDADPGDGHSWPGDFFEFKGDLYFTAEVFNAEFGSYFAQLFRVNKETGTAEKAVDMPIDLSEGVIVVGDYLYFAGLDSQVGFELFRSDGTNAGTTLTRDIMTGERDSNPRNFFGHDGMVYFAAGDTRDPETQRPVYNLWLTDGTPFGTKKVAPNEIDAGTPFVLFGDEVFYLGNSDELGWELFKTDGTPTGTGVVHDVNEGSADSFAIPQRVFDDQLLFIAEEESEGWEIWSYDGQTTSMLDTHIGSGDITNEPSLFRFHELHNDLLYVGSNLFDGSELYILRGTDNSTPDRFPGDVDENGKVEFADFLVLSTNFGNENAVWGDGDFDGSGKVDFADFLLMSDNFGKSAPLSASTVLDLAEAKPADGVAFALAVDSVFEDNNNDDDEMNESLSA